VIDPFQFFSRALAAQAEGHVLFHRQMGEQGVVLEYHADPAFFRGETKAGAADAGALQADFAAGHFFKSGNAAQQRGFAAARGTQQTGNPAGFDCQADVLHHGLGAVALNEIDDFELGHGGKSFVECRL